jgi:hypothetical protein
MVLLLLVAGIGCTGWLAQQHVHFLLRDRPVLNALGYNVNLAWPKRNGSIAQLDVQLPLDKEKEIVRLIVLVPNKLALHLYDHYVIAVELRHCPRRPVFRERREPKMPEREQLTEGSDTADLKAAARLLATLP